MTKETDYTVQTVPAVRLAALRVTLQPHEFEQRIGPLFEQVAKALGLPGGDLATPVATYTETDDGVDVVVGFTYEGDVPEPLAVVELTEQSAVCGKHFGDMSSIHASWESLHSYAVEQKFELLAPCREVYVDSSSDDQSNWITELQQPVTP